MKTKAILKILIVLSTSFLIAFPMPKTNGKNTETQKETEVVKNNESDIESDKEEVEEEKTDKQETVEKDTLTSTQKPAQNNKEETKNETVTEEKAEDSSVEVEVTPEVEENTEISKGYTEYNIPKNNGFKSYMSYLSIKTQSSYQYKLQSQYAYTGNYGIRQVNGRYCIAIGTFSKASIGTYVDLILENGTVIQCIVGDFKAPVHTDSSNIVTLHNGCVSEFIVDKNNLHSTAKKMGDVSYCDSNWKSPVKLMRVYDTNVFNTK